MEALEFFIGIFTNPLFLISLTFWLIIIALVFLLKNKKEAIYVFFPLIALLKTKKLNKFIKKISQKAPRFWKTFWTIGIFVSFSFTIFAFYFFFINMINLFIAPRVEYAVTPLIPGVTVDLPFFMYLILPILFVMTTHELAHGISASIEGVDVKSTGVLGAGFFYIIAFGAFVEVDERELYSSKYHRNTRLRIAAAGTYVNAITVGITFLLLINFTSLISPLYGAQVARIDTVLKKEEGGFNYKNLSEGDVLVALKKKDSNEDYLYLDGTKGITLSTVLFNKTEGYKFSAGDEITFKIYNPDKNQYSKKDIILGPGYNMGIVYEYISNSKIEITHIYSKEEKGNNYDKNLEEGLIITKINGTKVNVEEGDTLEKILTTFGLKNIELISEDGDKYELEVERDGVRIGILSKTYWMPKNEVGSLLTGELPTFILIELIWLWVIAFSVTLFNMLPLPIFDGDRIVKELINWGVGEEYNEKRKKKDRFLYKKSETDYGLTEYRVEKVDSVKIIIEDKANPRENSEILLDEKYYTLKDILGDGFKSTLSFNLPEQSTIKDSSIFEVFYEYWYDSKKPKKKKILNSIRLITLFIVLANFILSFIVLGYITTFWV
ncbi:MAG: site-2 protease family protein [Promethearchaeota archaeon]